MAFNLPANMNSQSWARPYSPGMGLGIAASHARPQPQPTPPAAVLADDNAIQQALLEAQQKNMQAGLGGPQDIMNSQMEAMASDLNTSIYKFAKPSGQAIDSFADKFFNRCRAQGLSVQQVKTAVDRLSEHYDIPELTARLPEFEKEALGWRDIVAKGAGKVKGMFGSGFGRSAERFAGSARPAYTGPGANAAREAFKQKAFNRPAGLFTPERAAKGSQRLFGQRVPNPGPTTPLAPSKASQFSKNVLGEQPLNPLIGAYTGQAAADVSDDTIWDNVLGGVGGTALGRMHGNLGSKKWLGHVQNLNSRTATGAMLGGALDAAGIPGVNSTTGAWLGAGTAALPKSWAFKGKPGTMLGSMRQINPRDILKNWDAGGAKRLGAVGAGATAGTLGYGGVTNALGYGENITGNFVERMSDRAGTAQMQAMIREAVPAIEALKNQLSQQLTGKDFAEAAPEIKSMMQGGMMGQANQFMDSILQPLLGMFIDEDKATQFLASMSPQMKLMVLAGGGVAIAGLLSGNKTMGMLGTAAAVGGMASPYLRGQGGGAVPADMISVPAATTDPTQAQTSQYGGPLPGYGGQSQLGYANDYSMTPPPIRNEWDQRV